MRLDNFYADLPMVYAVNTNQCRGAGRPTLDKSKRPPQHPLTDAMAGDAISLLA